MGETMIARLLLVACLFVGVTIGADFEGTWKLIPDKSKTQPEYTTFTMKIEKVKADTYHMVIDGTTKSGESTHQDATLAFDGKKRPSDAPGTTEISTHPDSRTWKTTVSKNGKTISEVDGVVAADNKTQRASMKAVQPDGKVAEQIFFYERQ
jgi:hypothetical protein